MRRGFLLGKFMPPQAGHAFLCDFAADYCDTLTVLVCTQPGEPIDGDLRYRWMREICPKARVCHFADTVPQEPSEHPNFWEIWRAIVKRFHPEQIDFVFASEAYGMRLATEVGATFVPVDIQRQAVPISATRVRDNPYAVWGFLAPPVRAHYVKTVCLFGPESTGKSILASKLAKRFHTIFAPEYGRTYCDFFGTDCDVNDLRHIVDGQKSLEYAARRIANRLLILDTDRLMTAIWADMLLDHRPADLDDVSEFADLYLLADVDVPWHDDGTRYFPDSESRNLFFHRCKKELEKRELPFVILSGDWDSRYEIAVTEIEKYFQRIF
jgi:NadR type nicotinamide-nucleotide adenylyltransferase